MLKHKISVTFVSSLIGGERTAKAKDDAKSIEWLTVIKKRSLAFDHSKRFDLFLGSNSFNRLLSMCDIRPRSFFAEVTIL
jgi:hypothetical protein